MDNDTVNETARHFLISTFYISDSLLGLDTMRVQEVIRVTHITPVHQAPDHILGIINLRGRIVTVIHLGRKLDLTDNRINPDSRILIVDWKNEYIGLLVDRVSEVVDADRESLAPPPANIDAGPRQAMVGVIQTPHHIISLLDVDQVLSEEEK